MKTRLLFRVALIFSISLFAMRYEAKAQVTADLNQGGMLRIFHGLTVLPNPFDDKLIISYTLPYDTEVVIELYNALGQEVRQYSGSAVRQNAGTHTVLLTRPVGANPGIYFLKLTVPDEGSLTKRVMAK